MSDPAEFRAAFQSRGLSDYQIAQILGVNRTTVQGWRTKGGPYYALYAVLHHPLPKDMVPRRDKLAATAARRQEVARLTADGVGPTAIARQLEVSIPTIYADIKANCVP